MRRSRQLVLALAVLAAVVLVTGSGGFDAVQADRGVHVAVADDEHAYLGIAVDDPTLTHGAHDDVVLLSLRNQFGRPLTEVSVTVTNDGKTPPVLRAVDAPASLSVGERGTVTADVTCGGLDRGETWTVTVVASGPGVETALSREVTVTCEGPPGTTTPTRTTTMTPATADPGA